MRGEDEYKMLGKEQMDDCNQPLESQWLLAMIPAVKSQASWETSSPVGMTRFTKFPLLQLSSKSHAALNTWKTVVNKHVLNRWFPVLLSFVGARFLQNNLDSIGVYNGIPYWQYFFCAHFKY